MTIYEPGACRIVVAPAGGERSVRRPLAFDHNVRTWEIVGYPDRSINRQVLQTLLACRRKTG